MTATDAPSVKRSRLKLIAVFAIFFGPLILAVVWYYGLGAIYAPRSGTNNAPLIQPPVPLSNFTNLQLDGNQITVDDLKGHWTVVHRMEQECGESCETALYNTRQTRIALGRDANRVRRILLGQDVRQMESVAEQHPDLHLVLRIDGGLGSQLIPVADANDALKDDAMLVDPLGNVMMVIPAALDPSKLLKDLKKLMKLSKVG